MNFENILDKISDSNFRILLENDRAETEKIIKFFASDNSLLIATGFLGTGKTDIVKSIVENINTDSILLWANCYESTNLDDIFLTFFEKFRHLASSGRIKIPQAKFENFSKRINACFSAIDKNIVVVINSYQALMTENMKPVNDFIEYLCEFKNIKVLIISRNFNNDTLSADIKTQKVTFKAFDEATFQKLLLNNKIKMYGPVADELYKLTKGYYFYTVLSIKIMLSSDLSMIDFIRKYSNSFMSFKEFLFQEILKTIVNPNPHLFRFLSVIRCPVNYKLLSVLQLYDEKFLKTLISDLIVEVDEGNIYLKDYYKDMSGADIPQNILNEIHKSCMELYELQLPRKPEDRDILISRKTIRQEIDYHKLFVPVKYVPKTSSVEIYNNKPIIIKAQDSEKVQPQNKILPNPQEDKPKELKDILFVFNEEEEKTVINGIAQSINDFMKNVKQRNFDEENMSDDELLALMNEAEDDYDYKKVINLSKKILLKQDANKDIKAYIAEKVANCYEKLSDIYNAIKYYETTENYLADGGNTHKILECEYNIARLNYKIFKYDYSKDLLLSLIKVQNPAIKFKSELLLFDIYLDEGNEEKAFETCKEALTLLDKSPDKALVCELMFKCGLILDIRKNYPKAIEAYERALRVSSSCIENKYLIQIYMNLAELYSEINDTDNSEAYCKKALEAAKENGDFENMFTSSLKLAELSNDEKVKLKLYNSAFQFAENTNDIYYKISGLISLGDYYFAHHKNMSALENYLKAYKSGKEGFYNDIEHLLNERMLSIKSVINSDVYIAKAKEYGYEQI